MLMGFSSFHSDDMATLWHTGRVARPSDPRVRAALVEQAAAMLAADEPLTLRAVAERSRTSTMAVYTHFGGMPGLRQAVRAEGFRRLIARLETVGETDDPVHDLAALGAAYVRHGLAHPHLYRAMFDPATRLEDEQVAAEGLLRLTRAAERARDRGRFRADPPTSPSDSGSAATESSTWCSGSAAPRVRGRARRRSRAGRLSGSGRRRRTLPGIGQQGLGVQRSHLGPVPSPTTWVAAVPRRWSGGRGQALPRRTVAARRWSQVATARQNSATGGYGEARGRAVPRRGRGWWCSTATGGASSARSTWCCATATCWSSARSRPGADAGSGRPLEAVTEQKVGPDPAPRRAVDRRARRPARRRPHRPGGGAAWTGPATTASTTCGGSADGLRDRAQRDPRRRHRATSSTSRPTSARAWSRRRWSGGRTRRSARHATGAGPRSCNSELEWPTTRRVTVLLSPADLPKRGSHFDLAIALAVLAPPTRTCPAERLRGARLPRRADARRPAARGPRGAADGDGGPRPRVHARRGARPRTPTEAAMVPGMDVLGRALAGPGGGPAPGRRRSPTRPPVEPLRRGAVLRWRGDGRVDDLDLADVHGMATPASRSRWPPPAATTCCSAGRRAPGKTTLAERLPGLLPDLGVEEALELSAVHSLAGEPCRRSPRACGRRSARRTTRRRKASVLGGGTGRVHPGELSRALHGVLFLDEFPLVPQPTSSTRCASPWRAARSRSPGARRSRPSRRGRWSCWPATRVPAATTAPTARPTAAPAPRCKRRDYRASSQRPDHRPDRHRPARRRRCAPWEADDPLARPGADRDRPGPGAAPPASGSDARYAGTPWRLNADVPGPRCRARGR